MATERQVQAGEPADLGRESAPDRCAACGSARLTPHFRTRGSVGADGLIPTPKQFGIALGDILRCGNCGHMQLDHFPSEEELAGEYERAASDDYVDQEPGQRASARRMLEHMERYVEPGPIVEFGPWVGFYIAEARDRGWDPVGIEPSIFAADFARNRLGLDVRTDDLFTADLPKGHYNAVVMGDVLEHLPRTGDALRRCQELLTPSGVLVLLLPNVGSRTARLLGKRWWSVIPTHIHYFTPRSASTMLERHGFQTVFAATDPKSFTFRYYLRKGGGYAPRLSRALVRAADRIGVGDLMWTPDFRDRMIVIARPSG